MRDRLYFLAALCVCVCVCVHLCGLWVGMGADIMLKGSSAEELQEREFTAVQQLD